nr:ribonuclease H-like domain-containing protein [Tanacetum cinerariifolium]
MESLSPHVVTAAKLPILDLNEFYMWNIRIEQYFLMIDYSLWEVILIGDSPAPTRVVDGVVQAIAPTTVEQRLAKKNELKARGTLLIAFLDKHQLKFNIHKDAKSLLEAIKKRFGGNKEKKKVQKTVLRQKYENFSGSSSESLDQIHDRLQKVVSQLEILVSYVPSVSAASTKPPVSAISNVDNLSDAVIYSFFECRLPRDTRNKDTQRRTIPVDTSTSNALVSQCDGVGSYDWSFQDDEEPTNYALIAFTSSRSSSSDNEVALYSKARLEYVEARLAVYQQNENVFEEDIKLLKLDVMLRDNDQAELTKKFKTTKKEIDDTVFDYDELNSSESDVSVPTSSVHDRPFAPIIEDWVSDSEDKYEGEPMPIQKAPSFVQTSEHVTTPRTSVKPVEHPLQAENLRQDILKSRDTGCVVLSFDFKLPDENHVLLRVLRENNMYNVDLKNIVPLGDLTFLFAKASLDEGLPSKVFENNHTSVACKKGKQHRASWSSPKWLFDIDTLTHSMNYQLVVAGNQANHNAGIQGNFDADVDAAFDGKDNDTAVHISLSSRDKPKKHDDKAKREAK